MVIIENLNGKTPHQVRLGETPVIRVRNRSVLVDTEGQIILFCHARETISEALCPTDFDLAIDYLTDPVDAPIEQGDTYFRTAA